jgi:beta-glucosidase
VLPLSGDGRVAVIGAFAAHARIQGGGSSGVDPTRVDNALDFLGDVVYAPGYVHTPLHAYQDDLDAYFAAHDAEFVDDGQGPARRTAALVEPLRKAAAAERLAADPLSARAVSLIDDAVTAAADVIVVFAGLPLAFEQEADDRTTLALPADQIALIGRLADLPAKLVVVLSNGAAVTMDPWHDRVDAIVEAWLPG